MTTVGMVLLAAVATEAVVEILMHSELFGWLRETEFPLFSCGWCLSFWVAAGAWALVALGGWWLLVPVAVHRISNLFHEIFGRVRG